MFYIIAPPCDRCGRMYVESGGPNICNACRMRQRHPSHNHARRPILCDCGQPATTVLLVNVGEDGMYSERMPVCQACLRLEQEWTR